MAHRAGALLLFLFLAAPDAFCAKKAFPPAPSDYIHNEGIVSPEAEARISQILRANEQKTGHQFVIALFNSLESESLEDYTNQLFKKWRIGSKEKDDGLLFVLFKEDRQWRVEVGYGLEGVLTDLESSIIIQNASEEHLKRGDLDGAMTAIAENLSRKLNGEPMSAPRRRNRGLFSSDIFILLSISFLIILLLSLFSHTANRQRNQKISSSIMAADIAYLVLRIFIEILFALLSGGRGGGGFGGGGFGGRGGSSGGGGSSGRW